MTKFVAPFLVLMLLVVGCKNKNAAKVATKAEEEILTAAERQDGIVRFADAYDNIKKWKNRDFKLRAKLSTHIPMKWLFSSQGSKSYTGDIPFTSRVSDLRMNLYADKLTEANAPDVDSGDEVTVSVHADNMGKYVIKKITRR